MPAPLPRRLPSLKNPAEFVVWTILMHESDIDGTCDIALRDIICAAYEYCGLHLTLEGVTEALSSLVENGHVRDDIWPSFRGVLSCVDQGE